MFRWWLRLNTAEMHSADQEVERAAIEVAPHSVQLLTAIVAAVPPSRCRLHRTTVRSQPEQRTGAGQRRLR